LKESAGVKPGLPHIGLRAELAGLILAAVAVLTAGLVVGLPRRLDDDLREWTEGRSLTVVRLLGRGARAPLDFDDRDAAETLLRSLEATPGADYAVLRRADGSELSRWRAPPGGAPALGPAEGVAYGGAHLHVFVPVQPRTGGAGGLQVGFDLGELERWRGAVRDEVALAGVLFVLFGGVAAFVVGTLVVRPLRRMTRVARRIAGGDAGARDDLETGRGDEVGALAVDFDRMLGRLAEKEDGLRSAAEELERRVERRTVQLADANRELAARLEELTRTQEQLVVADRRISIGRLAAGVAHEINNPLAFIEANLSFVAEAVDEAQRALAPAAAFAPVRASLAEMAGAVGDARQGSSRVRHIVRQLKNFSREDVGERGAVQIPSALRAALDMAHHETRHRARVVERLGPVPPVSGNEVRLSQVFLNLLVNAAQAMPAGEAERHQIRVETRTDERGWAVVEVSDTGCGMTPEVQARLFQPFFTTKPRGVGTGLGLSITQGIVAEMGGTIAVRSAPGRGTTFTISLPPTEASAACDAPPPADAPARPARLLVVDDEPMIGQALTRALPEHQVTVTGSGAEALDRVRQGGAWDCILCDVMMPEMTGSRLLEELRRTAPEAAAALVFMTGAVDAVQGTDVPMLEKPLDFAALRRLLAERAGARPSLPTE
jgi:signal transduction histidine kinase